MPQEFYAHSVEGKPVSQWHRLEEHLKGTYDCIITENGLDKN